LNYIKLTFLYFSFFSVSLGIIKHLGEKFHRIFQKMLNYQELLGIFTSRFIPPLSLIILEDENYRNFRGFSLKNHIGFLIANGQNPTIFFRA